jgi:hypothetical protein
VSFEGVQKINPDQARIDRIDAFNKWRRENPDLDCALFIGATQVILNNGSTEEGTESHDYATGNPAGSVG